MPTPLDLQALSSEELAGRAGGGCEASFEELVRRHSGQLRAFLALRVGNAHDAEDIAQETLIRARRNLGRYQPRYRFTTWLFTIGRRLAARPAARVEVRADAGESLVDERTPSATMAAAEERDNLWDAAQGALSAAQFESLWLMYGEGRSVREIAARTGRTAIHVRVLLHRARTRLAREWKGTV